MRRYGHRRGRQLRRGAADGQQEDCQAKANKAYRAHERYPDTSSLLLSIGALCAGREISAYLPVPLYQANSKSNNHDADWIIRGHFEHGAAPQIRLALSNSLSDSKFQKMAV
jgi:hypothetical protein